MPGEPVLQHSDPGGLVPMGVGLAGGRGHHPGQPSLGRVRFVGVVLVPADPQPVPSGVDHHEPACGALHAPRPGHSRDPGHRDLAERRPQPRGERLVQRLRVVDQHDHAPHGLGRVELGDAEEVQLDAAATDGGVRVGAFLAVGDIEPSAV
ncbi:hypothetical protein [Nonomuraea sp. NPDC049480]|uniref:hypothetical protein n=1 Tax=Nonomuraea sp. NPDC049480 TaxID=3364353 RepID=UPI00379D22A8